MSDINKIMEAYLGMVSAPQVEETLDEAVNMGPWNRGAINKAMAKAGIKGPQAKAFIAALRVSGTVAEEVESELDGNNLLERSILNKSSFKSKSSWQKALSSLEKMEKEFKGTKKEKDYYEILNSLFHTVDDWDPQSMPNYNTKTATKSTYGNDPISDLRYDLKNLLGPKASEIMESCGKKHYKEEREECPKCEGEGCDHCDGKGYHEIEEKKLDPVDDAENDKKFKNRKDKDIDNDGDVDSSDEYLHKRRKATDDAIDGGEKPAKESEVSADLAKAAAKADKVKINTDDDEIIKKRLDRKKKDPVESLEIDLSKSFVEMWQEMQEAIDPKKGATAPEKHDDHSSEHDKKVIAQHKKSDKKIEDEEEKSHDIVFKAAGKDMKQAPARSGADNLSNGDKTIVNPVKGK